MKRRGFRTDKALSYDRIEERTRKLRRVLVPEAKPTEPMPGLELFERLDRYKIVIGSRSISLTYDVKDLPVGLEALAQYEDEEITVALSASTYAALERAVPRARFSLCHEIGHAVLHTSELMRLARIPHHEAMLSRQAATDHPVYRDTEWQADAFAAALLMPADGLAALEKRGTLSAQGIGSRFGTSLEAASYRLDTFNRRRVDLTRLK